MTLDEENALLREMLKHAYAYANWPSGGYEKMTPRMRAKYRELIGDGFRENDVSFGNPWFVAQLFETIAAGIKSFYGAR